MFIEYIIQNWALILIAVAFAVSLKITGLQDRGSVGRMYILIAGVFLLSVVVFTEFYLADIGGFLIHRHLTSRTGIPFELYRMGITELQDQRFAHALRALTENDRTRAQILLDHPLYHEPVAYMLANNVKLEQEIVSYYDAGK